MQWSQDQGLWGLNQFLSKKLQLCIFNLYVRIPKGPMGQDGPSPLLVKLGLTVNTQLAVKIAHQFCTWVVSLAVMEELNGDKKACMFDFLPTNGQ